MPDLPTGLTSWVAAIDPLRDLLLILTPLFIATLLVEWLALRRRGVFRLGDSLASLGLGGLYLVVDAVLVAILVLPVYRLLFEHRLLQFEMTPLAFVLLFFLLEFCFFLFHWASHRIRWFWAAHVVHHSSRHMNFTTAMRQSLFYGFAGNWLFYLPLVWLGFAPEWVLFMLSVSLAYQYFLHTQGSASCPEPSSGCSTPLPTTGPTMGAIRSTSTATTVACSSSMTACSAPSSRNAKRRSTASCARWRATTRCG